MTLFLPLVILVPMLFSLPAWLIARRRYGATAWSLSYAVPGLVTWVALAVAGVGPQSLGNVVELLYLSFGAVPVYYLKVLFVDKVHSDTRLNTILATLMLCVAAIILRLTTPVMPE